MFQTLTSLSIQLKEQLKDLNIEKNINIVFVQKFQEKLQEKGLSEAVSEKYASYLTPDMGNVSVDSDDIEEVVVSLADTYAGVIVDADTYWRNQLVSMSNVELRVSNMIKAMTISF